jgi:hypothetical protein
VRFQRLCGVMDEAPNALAATTLNRLAATRQLRAIEA